MKLHRKIKQNKKVCRAQDLGSYAQGQGHRSEVKIMSKHNSKTTESNVRKLYGKIEHNEKVCRAQELGCYAQGSSHFTV